MGDDGRSNDQLLTVAEVADLMRLSRTTVYRLIKTRRLPAAQFGRSYRVAETEVHSFIARAMLDEVPDDGLTRATRPL
jgi:excisionase family DNA binding protein